MKKIVILMLLSLLYTFILFWAWSNPGLAAEKIPAAVKKIIQAKCVACHVPAPAEHATAFPQSNTQCASCHVPFSRELAMHETGECSACHQSPAETHFSLRGYNKADTPEQQAVTQAGFAPGVVPKCVGCHVEKALSNEGKGFPSLSTDAALIASVEAGTLRAWIQPGGFMAKYLQAAEVETMIAWIDERSRARTLGYDPVLVAVKTGSDFALDGTGTNPAWAKAPEHTIRLIPTIYTATAEIRLKALYTDKNLYIRAEWADRTLSMTRGGWEWNAGEWKHPYYDPRDPDNTKQSEDRLSIIWNMSTKDYRNVHGCAVKCHGNIPGSSEFTDHEGEKTDIWHSKAARGLGILLAETIEAGQVEPVTHEAQSGHYRFTGFLDDKVLVWYQAYALGYDLEDSGRRGDKGRSTYSHNRNESKQAPKVMESHPTDFSDAMVLTQAEIDAGETIVADPGGEGFEQSAVSAAWAWYQQFNALVPERILRTPSGSRGDVQHSATWKDGVWMNEFSRSLDTGHPEDDVIFDLSKATDYEFSVAVFDNCGRGEIPPGHTTYGDGQYQILKFQ